MRIQVDYGIHQGDIYKAVSRKAWILAVAVACQARVADIKEQIDKARKHAREASLYHPMKEGKFIVPWIAADLKIDGGRSWYYAQPYGKETAVCHAVKKFLEWKGLNYKVFDCFKEWDKESEKESCLDPAFNPADEDEEALGKKLIDELTCINYHSEAGQLQELLEKEEFLINELSEDTQQEILEKHRSWNVDFDDWADFMIDPFKEKLGTLGFLDPETYYRGFWSQGDGASFKAEIDFDTYIRAHLEDLIKARVDIFTLRKILVNDGQDWEIESHHITQSGRYYHEKTMDIELCWRGDAPKDIEDALTKMQGFILEDARDLAKEFYKSLEKEYDYQTSDEAIIESLNANDKKFTRDGEDI